MADVVGNCTLMVRGVHRWSGPVKYVGEEFWKLSVDEQKHATVLTEPKSYFGKMEIEEQLLTKATSVTIP